MLNKRGQGLSTNAIILIILGVVVLVALIMGFTMGWSKLAPWISTDNVQSIVTQCEVACSTSSVFDYCIKERELKVEGLQESEISKKVAKGSCYGFANDVDFVKYGIGKCPVITECDSVENIVIKLE